MASDVKEALTEEIALEGLDGITMNALWIRLQDRESFSFELDAGTKGYLWRCVLGLGEVEFFLLPKPRPDLVPFNRLHYIDPETKHFVETEDIPDDIYPIEVVDDNGIQGSCAEYKRRKNITEQVHNEKPSLEQAAEKYGNKLVMVASQDVRRRTLMGLHNDPGFMLTGITYAILERIGRSRSNGETTNGRMSLNVFKQNSKSMFYFLKMLRPLNALKKQRLFSVQKNSKGKLSCILYHLSRYYKQIGTRAQRDFITIAHYLASHPNQMAEMNKLKSDLKLYDHLKHVVRLVGADGGRFFVHVDVPYRDVYPTAKPRVYLRKNGNGEKMIRHLKMEKSLDEVKAALEANETISEDEEEEEDEEKEAVMTDPVPDLEYPNVLDEPQVHQVYKVIRASGSRGLSLLELMGISDMNRLQMRRIIKMLERTDCIDSIMLDRGRQKIVMYMCKDSIKDNTMHQSVTVSLDKLTERSLDDFTQPKTTQTNKKKNKDTKPLMPVLQEEEPSEDKVSKIRDELYAMDDFINPINTSQIEQIQALKLSGTVNVEIKEVEPKPVFNKHTKERMMGMKRFGSALTESHVRRANWIIDVLKAVKVLECYKLLKFLRNREKEMKLAYTMDGKSLQRIVQALIEEGKIKSYKIMFSMGTKNKDLTFLCLHTVSPSDDFFQRMIDEAKLRHFSVSKEELKKLHKLKRMPQTEDKYVNDSIPLSARESIRNYQEYRKKVAMDMPKMVYNRAACFKYGLLPKMLRVRAVHQYLYHLCYVTYNHSARLSTSPGTSRESHEQNDMLLMTDKPQASDLEWNVSDLPVYCEEFSWKRYCPPIPVHEGYKEGWCLISDVLLIMPVCFFCQVVNVSYEIEELVTILEHPERRYYPVIHLPFAVSQRLLHSRKYVSCFLECCTYLSEMGLLSFGREVLKDKDETFVYLHQHATLFDTRESLEGYNKTKAPPGHTFPERKFFLRTNHDLEDYWEFLQIMSLGSNMGHKSLTNRDLEDMESFEVRSITEATCSNEPADVKDDGVLPGDRRGAGGVDSSIFVFTNKNWIFKPLNHLRIKIYPRKPNMDIPESKGQSKVVSEDRIIGREKLSLTTDAAHPVSIKKVVRVERFWGNKGGKGVPHTSITMTNTHRRVKRMGRLKRIRNIKIAPRSRAKAVTGTGTGLGEKVKGRLKGDKKDEEIYRMRNKQRVVWTQKEDSVLLMCRVGSLIMDRKRKTAVIMYTQIRDYLHETCGEVSHDKTSSTVQRRLIFVLRNPQTEANLLLYYQEAMQDEFVLQNYMNKEFMLTDTSLRVKFKRLVDYLLDKFKSHDLQRCSLPETLEDLSIDYSIQCVGKHTQLKRFYEPMSRAEICHDVLRNILHSAVLLQDKMGRTHEMFKLLTQYPDVLLSNVIRELRLDGMFVINKKQYVKEYVSQLHSGLGLRNFKCSQRYLYCFKQRYLSPMFSECASILHNLQAAKETGQGQVTLPFDIKSGEMAILFPLILRGLVKLEMRIPEELAIIDMKGFYSFPWGRGKTHGFTTKADKSLQQTKQKRDLDKEQASKQASDAHDEWKAGPDRIVKDNNARSGSMVPEAGLDKDGEKVSKGKQSEASSGKGNDGKNISHLSETDLCNYADDNDNERLDKSEKERSRNVEEEESIELDNEKTNINDQATERSKASTDLVIVETGESGNELTVREGAGDKELAASLAETGDGSDEIVLQWENGTLRDITGDGRDDKPDKSRESLNNVEQVGVRSGRKMTLKEKQKICSAEAGNVKITEKKSTTLSKKTSALKKIPAAESVDDVDESYMVNAKEFTHVKTNRSEIVLPKPDTDFTNADPMCSSSVASRTFVCLRRVEDCSFEDIRVFNAQDNFVLKSCQIKLRLLDGEIDENKKNYGVEIFDENVETGEIVWKNDENSALNAASGNNENNAQNSDSKIKGNRNEMSDINVEAGNKMIETKNVENGIKDLVLEKSRMKKIWENLHKLIPFQINTDRMWEELKSSGASDQYVDQCHQVYDIITDNRELGIRAVDLKKQCQLGDNLRSVLNRLEEYSSILRVGVLGPRYVSLQHARPWVIHAYRNLKGRGLHIDEGKEDTPIDTEEISSTAEGQSYSETRHTSFEEDRITLPTGSDIKLVPFTKTRVEKMLPPKQVPITIVMPTPSKSVTSPTRAGETQFLQVSKEVAPENSDQNTRTSFKLGDVACHKNPSKTAGDGHHSTEKSVLQDVGKENPSPPKKMKESDKTLTDSLSSKDGEDLKDTTKTDVAGSNSDSKGDEKTTRDKTNTVGKFEVGNVTKFEEVKSDKTSVDSKTDVHEKDVEATYSGSRKRKISDVENDSANGTASKAAKLDSNSKSKGYLEQRCVSSQTDYTSMNLEDPEEEVRVLRKRKLISTDFGTVSPAPAPKSTYDRVRLVIQPWRKPEGGVNRPILKMMLESLMLFVMTRPACSFPTIVERYNPYMQPMVLRNLIDILEDLGCVEKKFLRKQPVTLFSGPSTIQIAEEEGEDTSMVVLPVDDCVLKLGQFCLEMYPNAQWPESGYAKPDLTE